MTSIPCDEVFVRPGSVRYGGADCCNLASCNTPQGVFNRPGVNAAACALQCPFKCWLPGAHTSPVNRYHHHHHHNHHNHCR
jgi:hypothetical protein